jgi:hypothetical protein
MRVIFLREADFLSMAEYTKAKFLKNPGKKTPVLQQTAVSEGLLAQTP